MAVYVSELVLGQKGSIWGWGFQRKRKKFQLICRSIHATTFEILPLTKII